MRRCRNEVTGDKSFVYTNSIINELKTPESTIVTEKHINYLNTWIPLTRREHKLQPYSLNFPIYIS